MQGKIKLNFWNKVLSQYIKEDKFDSRKQLALKIDTINVLPRVKIQCNKQPSQLQSTELNLESKHGDDTDCVKSEIQYDHMEKKAIEADKMWDDQFSIQIGTMRDKEGVNLKNWNQVSAIVRCILGLCS